MQKSLLILISFFSTFTFAQNLNQLSFGSDSTFEIATWNIEWFPKHIYTTDSLKKIFEKLEIDIWALQEIDDTVEFQNMVNNLDGYNVTFDPSYHGKLAFLYNSNSIYIDSVYEIYTDQQYWKAFPRAPFVLAIEYNSEKYFIINNHLKCCGNGVLDTLNGNDEENRRFIAMNYLKTYVDQNLNLDKVIILGDFNDELIDIDSNNVFIKIIIDSINYRIEDDVIANGQSANWSYPNWPSHIDHIIITNELFNQANHMSSIVQTIRIDNHFVGGFSNYDTFISDHLPVALKLNLNKTLRLNSNISNINIRSFPNPFSDKIKFSFPPLSSITYLTILNLEGKIIYKQNLNQDDTELTINTKHLTVGLYLYMFSTNKKTYSTGLIRKE